MKAMFFESSSAPFIVIEFDNKNRYKYEGFEIGELYLIKKRFYKKVGKLVDYLKSKSYITYKKVELNI
jgi:hypothetical protein